MAKSVGELFVTLKADSTRLTAEFKKATRSVEKSSAKIKKFAAASGAAFVGMSLALGKVISVTSQFEFSIARLGAISNTTGTPALKNMEKAALDVAAATKFTARDVAKGMNFMAMAGNDASNIIAGIPAVTELATAGMMDLAQASDIVTNVMAGFGMTAEELGHANDVMTRAITGANVDVSQLGQAFKFVGPVAKSAGVSFEEITAAISQLGNVGIQGTMAGTAMRGAITKLLSPSKKGAAILKKLGVSVLDSTGKMRPFKDIIRDLGPLANDTGALMEVFGLRAGPAMAALISQGADSLEDFEDRLRNSGITAKGIAEAQMNTLQGQMDVFKSQVEKASIALGTALLPALRKITGAIQSLMNWFNGLTDANKEMIAKTAGVATVATGAAAGLSTVALVGSKLVSIFAALKPALLVATKALAGVSAAVGHVALGVLGAIAILASLRELVLFYWDTISEVFNKVETVVVGTWNEIKRSGMELWEDFAPGWLKDFVRIVGEAAEKIKSIFKNVFGFIKESISFAADFWKGRIADIGQAQPDFEAIEIEEEIKKASKNIGNFLFSDEEMKSMINKWNAAVDREEKVASKRAQNLKKREELQNAQQKLQERTEKFLSRMESLESLRARSMDMWKKTMEEGAEALLKARTSKTPTALRKLEAGEGGMAGPALGDFETAVMGVGKSFENVGDVAKASAGSASQRLMEGAKSFAMQFVSKLGTAGEVAQGAMQGFAAGGPWGAVIGAILALLDKVAAFGEIVEILNEGLRQGPIATLQALLSTLVPVIKQFTMMITMFDNIGKQLGFFGPIIRVLGNVLEKVAKIMNNIMRGIASIWNKLLDKLAGILEKIKMKDLARRVRGAKMTIPDFSMETEKAKDSMKELNKEVQSAATNVPEGFKVAAARFRALSADGVAAAGGATMAGLPGEMGGLDEMGAQPSIQELIEQQNNVTINVQAHDPQEAAELIVGELERLQYENGGSTVSEANGALGNFGFDIDRQ